jgi:ERO1-like protein alpha
MDEHDFELDGWARWDMPSSDYYDTLTFPEGYTGYDGSEVWEFIHERICFKGYEYDDDHWKADFNKAVSGLHSMVSAQVIRGIKEKVDNGETFTEAEIWRDPKKEFQRRLGPNGETPQAIENLYFCFMLLLTAASKAKQRLLEDCGSGKIEPDAANNLKAVLSCSLLKHESVGVASRKLHDHAVKDSDSVEALWEARMRCRELLRIMNCVQCNKCRLHGKISVLGLTTAMQILVGRSGEGGDPDKVHRVELAALMTTLHKCSTAIQFCQEMK